MKYSISSVTFGLLLVSGVTMIAVLHSQAWACEMEPCDMMPPPMSSSSESSIGASLDEASVSEPTATATPIDLEPLITLTQEASASTDMCPTVLTCGPDTAECADLVAGNFRIDFLDQVQATNKNGQKVTIARSIVETFVKDTNPNAPLGFDLVTKHTANVPVKISWMLPLCEEAKIEVRFYLSNFDANGAGGTTEITRSADLGEQTYNVKNNGEAVVLASHDFINSRASDVLKPNYIAPMNEYAFMVVIRQKKYNPATQKWDLYMPKSFFRAIVLRRVINAPADITEAPFLTPDDVKLPK